VNIKSHVKTGDTVLVLTGKDAGKKGKVLDVLPKEGKVLITIHKPLLRRLRCFLLQPYR
jgi:ribosomal protein L24